MSGKIPPLVKINDSPIPPNNAAISIQFRVNREVIGTRKSMACTPNLELNKTKADNKIPQIQASQLGIPMGSSNNIKNKFETSSEVSLGVKLSTRGPIESLENHIGVKRYERVIKNAIP